MTTIPGTALGEVRLDLNDLILNGTDAGVGGYAYLWPNLRPGTIYRASNVDPLRAAKTRVTFSSAGLLQDPVTLAYPKVLASDAPGITHEGLQWVLGDWHLTNTTPQNQPRDLYFTVSAGSYVNVGLLADTTPQPSVVQVVSVEDRDRAETAADAAETYRDEAAAFVGTFTAPAEDVIAGMVEGTGPVDVALSAIYEPRDDLVRVSAQTLPNWVVKRASSQVGGSPARVLCVGDSTTAGVYSDSYSGAIGSTEQGGVNSYPAQLARRLTAAGVIADYSMSVPGHSGNPDPRWDIGTWSYGGPPVGPGANASLTSATAGQSMTVTLGLAADRYIVYFFGDSGTGTFDVTATGGSTVTVNTVNATAAIYTAEVIAPAASPANVLTFENVSGTVFVVGVEGWSTTNPARVRVLNAGVGGAKATDWASASGADTYGGLSFIRTVAPNLTIISLGINDGATSTATATVVAAVEAIATAALATGDVLLMSAVPHDGPTTLDDYNDAYLAGDYSYVDLVHRYGNNGRVMGLITDDNTHPNALGYADIAAVLTKALLV